MSLQNNLLYKFENYLLDPNDKILLRDGNRLPVTPKVFQLLTILVKNHGRVVEKEKLMAEIWADTFVEEGNLAFNVRMLRKALGDAAANPVFIETVPRSGYRFIAPVEEIPNPNAQINSPAPFLPSRKNDERKLNLLSFAAALLILIGITIFAAARYFHSDNSPSNVPILSAPFHSETFSHSGSVYHAAISPDGKTVAYVDRTGNKQGIWLRNLETATNSLLIAPADFLYAGINFTHSGDQIYFVRKEVADNAPSGLYRVSIAGGEPEKILERTQGWFSLSPDDRLISYVRFSENAEESYSVFVADAASGANERRVVTRAKPYFIADNQFAPDGESIAFAAGQSGNGGSDFHLMRVDLKTGAETEICPKAFFTIQNLEWLRSGDALLITASEMLNAKLRIWRVNASTGETEPLTNDASNYTKISLNRAADKIIAIEASNNYELSFAANFTSQQTLTPAMLAAFAPDGKIFYSSNDGDIWSINPDGSSQRQLTNHPSSDFNPRVSPDNLWVYFTSNRTGENQIWRMRTDGTEQTQIKTTEGGYARFISPDGKWVYYESGLTQTLWRVSAAGGDEVQISDKKIYKPAFSPDGSLVAYFFQDKEWKIGVANVEGIKQIRVIDYAKGKSPPVALAWSNDNQTLYFIARVGLRNLLRRQSVKENEPHFVAELGDKSITDFAISPDGKSFAYVRGSWLHDAVLISGLK